MIRSAGRFWKMRRSLGAGPGSASPLHKLMPGENVLRAGGFCHQARSLITKHLWVTRYDPRERYAAGELSESAPGWRRASLVRPGRRAARGHRRGGVVHLAVAITSCVRRLAGDAGHLHRVHARASSFSSTATRPWTWPGRCLTERARTATVTDREREDHAAALITAAATGSAAPRRDHCGRGRDHRRGGRRCRASGVARSDVAGSGRPCPRLWRRRARPDAGRRYHGEGRVDWGASTFS